MPWCGTANGIVLRARALSNGLLTQARGGASTGRDGVPGLKPSRPIKGIHR